MKQGVLITDGDQRSSLACVRALGRRGYPCFVLGPRRGSIASASRYAKANSVCPDPIEDPGGFFDLVVERANAWGIRTILPITEKSLRVLLPRSRELSEFTLPFPDPEVFERVSDKAQVIQAAGELGIAVPEQRVWASSEEALADPLPFEVFPVAIKPTRSVPTNRGGLPTRAVQYVQSPQEMGGLLSQGEKLGFPLLVQERIHGSGAGVFLLTWQGTLRAVVGHRRIREKPPSGGVSVVRESTVVDERLLEQSLALLAKLGWANGVAMVEYKVQDTTGLPYLMEINGRFWGSLQLAVDAGVDFPSLLLDSAQGRPPEGVVRGQPGVRTRWLLGDLDQLVTRVRKNRKALDLPPSAPGKGKAIRDFLFDFRPGVRSEVLRLSDPGPFLREVVEWFRGLAP